jgi:riboflavin synthase
MTVIEFTPDWFAIEATQESLRRSTIGGLRVGSKVNLERAMKLSDRIGGHLVSGHVDAIAKVSRLVEEGFSRLIWFELPAALAAYFVEKGSVAVEGVSLTVVDIEPSQLAEADQSFRFSVALIPHTMQVTTLGALAPGSAVNIETDLVARYVARWALPYVARNLNKEGTIYPFALEPG